MIKQRILVADCETTGFGPKADLVELAWCEIDEDLQVLGSVQQRLRPLVPIHEGAQKVHGISIEMVKDCPTHQEFAESFHPNYFKDVFLICHNIPFDRPYLERYWTVNGVFCSLEAARKLYPKVPGYKLQTLREYFNLEVPYAQQHTAMGDVQVLLALLKWMVADQGTSLTGLVDIMYPVP